ncbi:aminotransferase class V-fold PLP-dependent enzyme [Paraglaciecola sp.]|uniref:aminotransferase class V-fold PLP-dependent enzyme n=1 Tax=Paraglaciecola sp. TaxID=1920173 RepID=UPI00273F3502|nr:aminotransferase class V-fold PLP-dependent enzyme [Paraglaciecola sp.]MDP5029619.1 aminotransferase class V-fold PLP-dependent enzyme [Paraglaciecola sp.]
MNLDIAAQFAVPQGMYLLSHSVGCLSHQARHVLNERYLNPWQQHGGEAWPLWLGIIDDFCHELGGVLGVDAKDICPQQNVSSALTKYLMSMPVKAHKNVILMHASAFPSLGFVAKRLEQQGYRFELIPENQHPRDCDVWADKINHHTAIVLITHVHSNSGIKSPVADIAKLAKAQNAKVVVDIAQSVGVVPIDITQWQVDCVLGSCVKWLCGGPGAGFIWLESAQLSELQPIDVGWFSHANPFEFDIEHFVYANDAKRFWGGTPNVASYATALGSLQQLKKIGIEQIAKHNFQLREKVYQAAQPLLLSQHKLKEEGGTLCLDFKPAALLAVIEDLTALNAHYDQRAGVLRLSFHIYNTALQATELIETLKKLRM